MILDKTKRKRRRTQIEEAVHIVALWNLMLILIPFLLLSADFSRTTILNLFIPSISTEPPPNKMNLSPTKEMIQLTLKLNGFILAQGTSQRIVIPFRSGIYDFPALLSALQDIKNRNPGEETIVLSGSQKVSYETLVQTMDECREARFSNITLGSDSPGEEL